MDTYTVRHIVPQLDILLKVLRTVGSGAQSGFVGRMRDWAILCIHERDKQRIILGTAICLFLHLSLDFLQ